jgi:hypothetical protein
MKSEMPIAAIKGRALPIAFPPPFGPYRLLIAELGQFGKVYYFSDVRAMHNCPLWVKRGPGGKALGCLLYPYSINSSA